MWNFRTGWFDEIANAQEGQTLLRFLAPTGILFQNILKYATDETFFFQFPRVFLPVTCPCSFLKLTSIDRHFFLTI